MAADNAPTASIGNSIPESAVRSLRNFETVKALMPITSKLIEIVADRTARVGDVFVPAKTLERATFTVRRTDGDDPAYCVVVHLPAASHIAPFTVWTGPAGVEDSDRERAVIFTRLLATGAEGVVDESERRETRRRAKRSRTASADESDSSNSIPARLAAVLAELAASEENDK